MDINKLTPEERKALMEQLEEQQKEEKRKIEQDRKAYKMLVSERIPALCEMLKDVSIKISESKTTVYKEMKQLIDLKQEVYQKDDGQFTHSFTTDDGRYSLSLGHRVNDGWDDTVHVGIAKVKEYINSLSKDRETSALVELVLRLLSKDAKGNLKASRVLQLKKMADDTGNKDFIDAIEIIQNAYRPAKTKQFLSVRIDGSDYPLNITDAEITN